MVACREGGNSAIRKEKGKETYRSRVIHAFSHPQPWTSSIHAPEFQTNVGARAHLRFSERI